MQQVKRTDCSAQFIYADTVKKVEVSVVFVMGARHEMKNEIDSKIVIKW